MERISEPKRPVAAGPCSRITQRGFPAKQRMTTMRKICSSLAVVFALVALVGTATADDKIGRRVAVAITPATAR